MVAKVEKNPLKKVPYVENAIAATFDHFDFVIHSMLKFSLLDKPCVAMLKKSDYAWTLYLSDGVGSIRPMSR